MPRDFKSRYSSVIGAHEKESEPANASRTIIPSTKPPPWQMLCHFQPTGVIYGTRAMTLKRQDTSHLATHSRSQKWHAAAAHVFELRLANMKVSQKGTEGHGQDQGLDRVWRHWGRPGIIAFPTRNGTAIIPTNWAEDVLKPADRKIGFRISRTTGSGHATTQDESGVDKRYRVSCGMQKCRQLERFICTSAQKITKPSQNSK